VYIVPVFAVRELDTRRFVCAALLPCSVRLAPRATHTTCLDVDDIEGTHPAVKDRAKVFSDRKAMAAAATAQQAAAQTVLSGLELSQRELLLLWNECSRLDRERCGFLTGVLCPSATYTRLV